MEFIIESQSAIDLRKTVLSHGWIHLAPWRWNDDQNILCRIERFLSGETATIKVTQRNSKELIVLIERPDGNPEKGEVDRIVRRWLSLDWDPKLAVKVAKNLSPQVSKFIQKGGGRFLRGSTFFEDFVKTVCTMNASWAFTKKTVDRFVKHLGKGRFPKPIQVIDAGQIFLQEEIRLGYRSKVLIQATDSLLEKGLIDRDGNGNEESIEYDKLIDLWGIGQYAAGHLMVLLHDFSRIPIDSEVIKYCRETFNISENEISDFYSEWRDFSFLGYKLNRIISKTNWIG